jgi:hypothetical protein
VAEPRLLLRPLPAPALRKEAEREAERARKAAEKAARDAEREEERRRKEEEKAKKQEEKAKKVEEKELGKQGFRSHKQLAKSQSVFKVGARGRPQAGRAGGSRRGCSWRLPPSGFPVPSRPPAKRVLPFFNCPSSCLADLPANSYTCLPHPPPRPHSQSFFAAPAPRTGTGATSTGGSSHGAAGGGGGGAAAAAAGSSGACSGADGGGYHGTPGLKRAREVMEALDVELAELSARRAGDGASSAAAGGDAEAAARRGKVFALWRAQRGACKRVKGEALVEGSLVGDCTYLFAPRTGSKLRYSSCASLLRKNTHASLLGAFAARSQPLRPCVPPPALCPPGLPPPYARRPGLNTAPFDLDAAVAAVYGEGAEPGSVRLWRRKLIRHWDSERPPYYGSWSRCAQEGPRRDPSTLVVGSGGGRSLGPRKGRSPRAHGGQARHRRPTGRAPRTRSPPPRRRAAPWTPLTGRWERCPAGGRWGATRRLNTRS